MSRAAGLARSQPARASRRPPTRRPLARAIAGTMGGRDRSSDRQPRPAPRVRPRSVNLDGGFRVPGSRPRLTGSASESCARSPRMGRGVQVGADKHGPAQPSYMIHLILYHVSCITYHVSCIIYHISCIMYHLHASKHPAPPCSRGLGTGGGRMLRAGGGLGRVAPRQPPQPRAPQPPQGTPSRSPPPPPSAAPADPAAAPRPTHVFTGR